MQSRVSRLTRLIFFIIPLTISYVSLSAKQFPLGVDYITYKAVVADTNYSNDTIKCEVLHSKSKKCEWQISTMTIYYNHRAIKKRKYSNNTVTSQYEYSYDLKHRLISITLYKNNTLYGQTSFSYVGDSVVCGYSEGDDYNTSSIIHMNHDGTLRSEKIYVNGQCITAQMKIQLITPTTRTTFSVICDTLLYPLDTTSTTLIDSTARHVLTIYYNDKGEIEQTILTKYTLQWIPSEWINTITISKPEEPMCIERELYSYHIKDDCALQESIFSSSLNRKISHQYTRWCKGIWIP